MILLLFLLCCLANASIKNLKAAILERGEESFLQTSAEKPSEDEAAFLALPPPDAPGPDTPEDPDTPNTPNTPALADPAKSMCCDPRREYGRFGNPSCPSGHKCCPTTGKWVCRSLGQTDYPCSGAPQGPWGRTCGWGCCDPKREPGKWGNPKCPDYQLLPWVPPIVAGPPQCCPETGRWACPNALTNIYDCPNAPKGTWGPLCENCDEAFCFEPNCPKSEQWTPRGKCCPECQVCSRNQQIPFGNCPLQACPAGYSCDSAWGKCCKDCVGFICPRIVDCPAPNELRYTPGSCCKSCVPPLGNTCGGGNSVHVPDFDCRGKSCPDQYRCVMDSYGRGGVCCRNCTGVTCPTLSCSYGTIHYPSSCCPECAPPSPKLLELPSDIAPTPYAAEPDAKPSEAQAEASFVALPPPDAPVPDVPEDPTEPAVLSAAKPMCCDPRLEYGRFGNPACPGGYKCCPTTGKWVCKLAGQTNYPCSGASQGPWGKTCGWSCCDPKREPGKWGNPKCPTFVIFPGGPAQCCPDTGLWVCPNPVTGAANDCPNAPFGTWGPMCDNCNEVFCFEPNCPKSEQWTPRGKCCPECQICVRNQQPPLSNFTCGIRQACPAGYACDTAWGKCCKDCTGVLCPRVLYCPAPNELRYTPGSCCKSCVPPLENTCGGNNSVHIPYLDCRYKACPDQYSCVVDPFGRGGVCCRNCTGVRCPLLTCSYGIVHYPSSCCPECAPEVPRLLELPADSEPTDAAEPDAAALSEAEASFVAVTASDIPDCSGVECPALNCPKLQQFRIAGECCAQCPPIPIIDGAVRPTLRCCNAQKQPGKYGNPPCLMPQCCLSTGEWVCAKKTEPYGLPSYDGLCPGTQSVAGPWGKACDCSGVRCPALDCPESQQYRIAGECCSQCIPTPVIDGEVKPLLRCCDPQLEPACDAHECCPSTGEWVCAKKVGQYGLPSYAGLCPGTESVVGPWGKACGAK